MSRVLIYNLNDNKNAKLKMLCRKLNIEARTVDKNEYGYKLRFLSFMEDIPDDAPKANGTDFDDEMLYLCGFSGGMLNIFLDQLRRNKLIIPLKAVQTETNSEFTTYELHRELCAERKAIAENMTAHKQ